MPTVKVWIAYDNDEQSAVSTEDAETAMQDYASNFTAHEDGVRLICIDVELPQIKPLKASIDVPDTNNGKVTVTVS